MVLLGFYSFYFNKEDSFFNNYIKEIYIGLEFEIDDDVLTCDYRPKPKRTIDFDIYNISLNFI